MLLGYYQRMLTVVNVANPCGRLENLFIEKELLKKSNISNIIHAFIQLNQSPTWNIVPSVSLQSGLQKGYYTIDLL